MPCNYHVTFRERILFFTKSICKNSINCQSFKNFEGKERKGRGKGGKRRKSGGEGGKRKEERGGGKELNSEKCRLLHMTVMGISYDLYCAISMSICTVMVAKFSQGSV